MSDQSIELKSAGEDRDHEICSVRSVTDEHWQAIWMDSLSSTYFHSPGWARLWEQYSEGKLCPSAKLVTFRDGEEALIVLSAVKCRRGLITSYLSSPAGTYGGWITRDQLDREHCQALALFLRNRHPDLFWRVNPFDEMQTKLECALFDNDRTYVLDLTSGFVAIEKLWSKGSNATQRKVRKARQSGVTIREAESEGDWLNFFETYQDSLERWGDQVSSRYEWGLFDLMRRMPGESVKLWLGETQGRVACGAICVYSPSHTAYWLGAGREEYFSLRPVNYLMYEIVKDACTRSCKWFDFNPSGGHEGVEAFKRSFGAVPLDCPVLHTTSVGERLLSKVLSLL